MLNDHIFPVTPPRSDSEPSLKPRAINHHSEGSMATPINPSDLGKGTRPLGAIRRSREPPRNDLGQIICDHLDCHGKNPVFRRPCEWNKHMDRHERPYKCREAGCELNPGFTYSGGLLRHQREVHKMYLSTAKKPLYCPVHNCNRSNGAGFTRRENLEEHKRRRHVGELSLGSVSPPNQHSATTVVGSSHRQSYGLQAKIQPMSNSFIPHQQISNTGSTPVRMYDESRKRKRSLTPQVVEAEAEDEEDEEEEIEDEDEDDDEDHNDEDNNEAHHESKYSMTRQHQQHPPQQQSHANWSTINHSPSIISQEISQTNNFSLMIKRLRAEIVQRDDLIRRQSNDIQRLQNIIRSLPAQAVYGIMNNNSSSSNST